jgi:hypothetical protein
MKKTSGKTRVEPKSPLHNPDMKEYKAINNVPDKRKKQELLKAGWTMFPREFYGKTLEMWASSPDDDIQQSLHGAYQTLRFRLAASIEQQQIKDGKLKIPCNKCGQETGKLDKHPGRKHHVGYYGLINASVTGGYYSEDLSDCVRYKFSLCEKCLAELMLSFKIPVKQQLYM